MTEPKIRFLKEDGNFFPKWETTFIGEIVERQEHPVKVDKEVEYREIGIRSHGKGIFHKDPVTGKELGNKRVFDIVPDCLVLNIVFAWERAVAKTTTDEVGMIASHRFPMYKPKDGILDLDYIVRYLISDKGKKILELASPGGAGRNRTLGQKAFMESELPLPCYEEQKKIAEFFDKIDDVISNVENELEAYKRLKAGMLQKMFPRNGSRVPEVRFQGFTENWEQRKLESLCDVFTDGDWIEAKDQSDSGVRLVQTGNVGTTEYLDKENNKKWISEETFERLHCEEIYEGDILISRLPEPAGRACIMPNLGTRMITAVDCTIVRTSKEFDSKYLVQYLSTPMYFKVVNSFLGGGTRQRISRGSLSGIDIPIPSTLEEQNRIGEYFANLDNLITLQQRELDIWNKMKTGYLQRMFI